MNTYFLITGNPLSIWHWTLSLDEMLNAEERAIKEFGKCSDAVKIKVLSPYA